MKRILLYCPSKENCKCFSELIKKEFEISISTSKKSFLEYFPSKQDKPLAEKESARLRQADAAIICLYSDDKSTYLKDKNKIDEFLRIESFAGHIPVFSCTKELKIDFFLQAADKGIRRFLSKEMEIEKIIALINDAINQNDLRKFIEKKFPICFERTTYGKKIIDIILHNFPRKFSEDEISKEINVSKRWIQHECKKAFNITYKKLVRIIWVYQAVGLLHKTNFSNDEIALQLNYIEESSMVRDFRKVLSISPNEVRKKLSTNDPDQLFNLDSQ